MQKNVDLILSDIKRSDNEKLHYKSDIMKAFITSRFFDLDPEEDIIKEYEQYEKKVMENYVVEFAAANGLDPSLVFSILNEYLVDERSITKNKIRERLADMKLPLLKQIKLINAIMTFIKNMYDKFTIEGV